MVVLFLISAIVCVAYGRLVVSWLTTRKLGYDFSCPGPFLRNSTPYHIVHFSLYGTVLWTGYLCAFPLWWLIPIFVITLTITRYLGHRRGFVKYRGAHLAMLEDAKKGYATYSETDLETIRAIAVLPNSVLKRKMQEQLRHETQARR